MGLEDRIRRLENVIHPQEVLTVKFCERCGLNEPVPPEFKGLVIRIMVFGPCPDHNLPYF